MSIYYDNPIRIITNSLITEYDIRKANVSVMEAYGLAPKEVIDNIRSLPRLDRQRAVGLMIRDDKVFADKLEASFDDIIQKFLKENDLDLKADVTDIRRDAVYVIGKVPRVTQFFDGIIEFRPKGEYHAVVKLGPKLGFFFRTKEEPHVEVDGFLRDDLIENQLILEKLRPGMIAFLEEAVGIIESSHGEKEKIYAYMRDFVHMYKARELDDEYYREFNRDAKFRVFTGETDSTLFDSITEDQVHMLDISFNFKNIIIPFLQIIV